MSAARVGHDFDPMRGPAAVAQGAVGSVRIGGLEAGALTEWRVVVSPTTQAPTLIGQGRFLRFYRGAIGCRVRAEVTPAARPSYIGRPTPGAPRPFAIEGTLHELSGTSIVISHGTIVRG